MNNERPPATCGVVFGWTARSLVHAFKAYTVREGRGTSRFLFPLPSSTRRRGRSVVQSMSRGRSAHSSDARMPVPSRNSMIARSRAGQNLRTRGPAASTAAARSASISSSVSPNGRRCDPAASCSSSSAHGSSARYPARRYGRYGLGPCSRSAARFVEGQGCDQRKHCTMVRRPMALESDRSPVIHIR